MAFQCGALVPTESPVPILGTIRLLKSVGCLTFKSAKCCTCSTAPTYWVIYKRMSATPGYALKKEDMRGSAVDRSAKLYR